MKKLFFALSTSFCLIASPVFAENACLSNISQHYWAEMSDLDLSDCNLQSEDMNEAAKFINENHVKYLSLANNHIGDTGVTLLSQNHSLIDVSLENTGISDAGLKLVVQGKMLRSLDISNNKITDQGISVLADYARDLQWILLSSNPVTSKSIEILTKFHDLNSLFANNDQLDDSAAMLLSRSQIEFLQLNNNRISAKGAAALAEMKNLHYLFLDANPLVGTDGVKAIAKNVSIRTLSLSADSIDHQGIVALIKMPALQNLILNADYLQAEDAMLLAHANISALELDDNFLGNAGMKQLASSHSLSMLRAANNRVGDEGAYAFAANSNIWILELDNNNITAKGALSLAGRPVLMISQLNLNNNLVGNEGAAALSTSSYAYLYLSNCSIGDDGAMSFAMNTHNGVHLDLSFNNITAKGTQALKNNPDIFILNLEGNDDNVKQIQAVQEQQASKLFMQKMLKQLCVKNKDDVCNTMLARA